MSKGDASTIPSRRRSEDGADAPIPRVVAAFADGRPICVDQRLDVEGVLVGRGGSATLVLDDASVSRAHARIGFDGARWTVEDLGSRNGTFVDGRRVRGEVLVAAPRVIRVGDSVLFPLGDLAGSIAPPDLDGPRVIGERVRRVFASIASLASVSQAIYFRGESGSGKELAARELHRCARPSGPFIAVNCAAIPEALAESLLFGVRRGAFSGATEAREGFVRAANGGVLFLDEIAELSLSLQSKLLRALETRSVIPVGDTHSYPVDLLLCVATHHDLRARVRDGEFREDLYYRLGRPMIELPPLRRRLEELPWLVTATLAALDPSLTCEAALLEACALRPWPGNIRELITEVRVAGQRARAAGRTRVERADLAEDAGVAIDRATPGEVGDRREHEPSVGQRRQHDARAAELAARREEITAALAAEDGNVSAAARRLGVHRNQLRRWLTRLEGQDEAE
ncbi:MAG: sigma 54-interacting transcriptional regulator [Nannocystaceae bacterium]|nr:sigma 54-interacting transcriptional regulator [Myxococcales bacterium]